MIIYLLIFPHKHPEGTQLLKKITRLSFFESDEFKHCELQYKNYGLSFFLFLWISERKYHWGSFQLCWVSDLRCELINKILRNKVWNRPFFDNLHNFLFILTTIFRVHLCRLRICWRIWIWFVQQWLNRRLRELFTLKIFFLPYLD